MHISSSNSRLKTLREIISRLDSFGVLVTDEEANFEGDSNWASNITSVFCAACVNNEHLYSKVSIATFSLKSKVQYVPIRGQHTYLGRQSKHMIKWMQRADKTKSDVSLKIFFFPSCSSLTSYLGFGPRQILVHNHRCLRFLHLPKMFEDTSC